MIASASVIPSHHWSIDSIQKVALSFQRSETVTLRVVQKDTRFEDFALVPTFLSTSFKTLEMRSVMMVRDNCRTVGK